MARVTLEPVGRFAFLVMGVHAAFGLMLWWWLHNAHSLVQGSDGQQQLVWVSPADFTSASTPVVVPPAPKPAEPEKPKTEAATPPVTAPVVMTTSTPAASPDEDNVPKAIAIDPAQALALMARAQATPPGAAKPTAPVQSPAPAAPSPPVVKPEPKPVVAEVPPAKPELKPEPKPIVAEAPPSKPDPKPPVVEAPKPMVEPAPPPPPPATEGSRFVTVSHAAPKPPAKELPKVASLLDMAALDAATTGATGAAKGIRLDEVDKAIISAFLREWLAPDATKLGLDQRTVSLDVVIDRDGRVVNFVMPRKSGSDDLDLSVLEAADRLGKIEATLPATYPSERYEFQVNFHVE